MDDRDLLALLRDRIRPGARPDNGNHDEPAFGRLPLDGGDGRDAGGERPPFRRSSEGEPGAFDAAPAIAAGGGGPDLVAIDGLRPFPLVLRDFVDAERRSRPGGFVVVLGIDPAPAPPANDGGLGDGATGDGWRIAPCLRRRRPGLALWALDRGQAPPAGALVVGNLDPADLTLERGFDRIVAEARADRAPAVGCGAASPDDPAFATLGALLAAPPDRRGARGGATPAAPAACAPSPAAEPGWRRAEERCIHAYYEGRHAEGLAACDEVLASPGVPLEVRAQTLRNATFYAPTLASLVGTFDHRRIDLDLPPGWFATNPSIAADGDGYLAIVRTLDYEIVGPHQYRFHDPGGHQHTINQLVRLDADLGVRAAFPLIDATLLQPRHACQYAGLEDCRLVRWRGEWVASCGTVDRTPSCVGKIDLVRLDPASGTLHSATPLSDRASSRWEKNWMPAVAGDELLFVYGCDPLIVLRADPAAGVEPYRHHPAPPIAREIKGGSQGVRVPGGWLFCVHQSADFPDRNRCYLHRFMLLDDDFRLTRLSRPFTFLAPGIEFCAGLALRGDEVVASFGVEDREAHLIRTSLPEVLALLHPVGWVDAAGAIDDAAPSPGLAGEPARAAGEIDGANRGSSAA